MSRKPRLPLPVVLKQERYEDASDTDIIRKYDNTVRHYYDTRTGGTSENSWSEQIYEKLGKEARPHMLSFLQSKGFLLK
jgi:nitroreductase